jgi:hypothetical protein
MDGDAEQRDQCDRVDDALAQYAEKEAEDGESAGVKQR